MSREYELPVAPSDRDRRIRGSMRSVWQSSRPTDELATAFPQRVPRLARQSETAGERRIVSNTRRA